MVSDPRAKTSTPAHAVLAVVLQVRDGRLQVLLWERALEPFAGSWSLPGGDARRGRDARGSRSAATSRPRSTSASSRTSSSSRRCSEPGRNPLALGARDRLPRPRPQRRRPGAARRHALAPGRRRCRSSRFDHGPIVLAGRERLRAKLSYTNVGFALAPGRRSRSPSCATSTAPRSATTSRRRTSSASCCAGTCSCRPASRREPGPAGGRPAALFGFATRDARDHRPVRGAATARPG